MEQLSKERIERIKNWNKRFTYKPGTMAYRVLKFLESGPKTYGEIKENERFNYERNLRNLLDRYRWAQGSKASKIRVKKEFQEILKMDDLPERTKRFFESKQDWYDTQVYLFKKDGENRRKLRKEIQKRIKEGKPWYGSLPGEPNFSQLIAVMLVDGKIEKIEKGVYKLKEDK